MPSPGRAPIAPSLLAPSLLAAVCCLVAACDGDDPPPDDGGVSEAGPTDGGPLLDLGADGLPSALEPDAGPDGGALPDADFASPCTVGTTRCVDDDTFARCLRDRTWGVRDCDPGQACHPATGLCRLAVCEPGSFTCEERHILRRCNATGTEVDYEPCPRGTRCDSGDCLACAPDDGLCVDDHTVRLCIDNAWGEGQPCPNATLCAGGRCRREACITRVMLLVDRSGSMGAAWSGVRDSIGGVLEAHPEVYFGLSSFPSSVAGCGLDDPWPDATQSTLGRVDVVQWMTDNRPGGGTPLIAAMARVVAERDTLWNAAPSGHLVVFTDGADSCGCAVDGPDCATAELSASAEALLATGIQTHVIGYAFGGDPATIDALAAAGGGPFDAHIPAGDEAALAEVFDALVDDIKLCP